MKNTFLIMIILILLTACGTSNSAQNGSTLSATTNVITTPAPTPVVIEAKVSDYFAFAKDTHMKYKGTGNEYASFSTFVEYLKDNIVQVLKSNGGTDAVDVYVMKDGAIKKVFNRAETYYNYDFTSSSNMDEIILMEPIKVGTSWTLSDGGIRSITAVDKLIKTPAGEYTALEITTKRTADTIKEYYVKDIGFVKSEFSSNTDSSTIISELELVEKGTPHKQTIRFYLPKFSDETVVYIDRATDIFTNEDMKAVFEKGFKTIPEGSGLSKVLSPNSKILGIKLDDKNETVTVDFDADLIKEMNAGSSFESLFISSITNTIGNYYQKSKVIITIEGQLYESGHFMLNTGEYFTVKTDDVLEYKKP